MCGRYTLRATPAQLHRLFRLLTAPLPFQPRYNIAPSQSIPAVRVSQGQREIAILRWGLVPRWANDPAIGNRMINARAETVAEKPAYRDAFRHRRCLVPADGFYEWQAHGKQKQPHYIHRPDGSVFAIAGIWEPSIGEGEPDTVAILTTTPNAVTRQIHDRMPAIIQEKDFDAWLDPATPPAALQALLKPLSDDALTSHPVGRGVNAPANDGPACIEAAAPAEEPRGLFG